MRFKRGENVTLKEMRIQKGYTQKFVAKKLNVDQAAISHWESGKHAPSKKYHKKIAKLYECCEADVANAIKETQTQKEG